MLVIATALHLVEELWAICRSVRVDELRSLRRESSFKRTQAACILSSVAVTRCMMLFVTLAPSASEVVMLQGKAGEQGAVVSARQGGFQAIERHYDP